ncbi:NUDIX hydrolase domain-like protein [Artemisia annua]|uniref:NUDIX hydrolase domain-like protein n=1 Tax=Artemisia annua TaxID=35608 RepID=A0A2U1NAW3_ARTAN|nr:NUDIX hydrolase domain-like protein [Artemisia annua]
MATVSLGTFCIWLDVDRGLTSGKNIISSQSVYKFLNSSQQRCVMKPIKSSTKIVEERRKRAFSLSRSNFQTRCLMFPSDSRVKTVGASHIDNGARAPEVEITLFIVKYNKILLGRRRVACNNYNLPSGYLKYGVSFEEGIKREVMKETGLDITNLEDLTTTNHIIPHVHAVVTYRHASLSDPNKISQNIEPKNCEGWDWYDLKNLPLIEDKTTDSLLY